MLDFGLARQYTNTTGEVRPVRPPSHASQGASLPHHHSNRSACDVAHFLQLCWTGCRGDQPITSVLQLNVSSFDLQSCDFSVFFLQFLWIYDFDVHASHFSIISMVTQGCEWFLW